MTDLVERLRETITAQNHVISEQANEIERLHEELRKKREYDKLWVRYVTSGGE